MFIVQLLDAFEATETRSDLAVAVEAYSDDILLVIANIAFKSFDDAESDKFGLRRAFIDKILVNSVERVVYFPFSGWDII